MSWIYDGTVLSDLRAVPPGEDPLKYVRAVYLNAARDALVAGKLHGLAPQASRPTATGATRYLWVRTSDAKLLYYNGTTDVDLAAGGHEIREAGVAMTARAGLNFTADFDLTDDAGDNETEVALAAVLAPQEFATSDAANTTALDLLTLRRTTSHASNGAAGLGVALAAELESSDGLVYDAGSLAWRWDSVAGNDSDSYAEIGAKSADSGVISPVRVYGVGLAIGNASPKPDSFFHVRGTAGTSGAIFEETDAANGTALTAARFRRVTSHVSNGAAGIGVALLLQTEDAAGNVQDTADITGALSVATSGSEKGYLRVRAMSGAAGTASLADGVYIWGTGRVGIGTSTTEPSGTLHVKTLSGVAAAFVPLTIDKLLSSTASNKMISIQTEATERFFLECDAANAVNLGTPAGNAQAVRLHVGGTSQITFHPTLGLFTQVLQQMSSRRHLLAKGPDVASASSITLGTNGITGSSGNTFAVTGTTTVNSISATDWQAGSVVYLLPQGTITFSTSAGNIRCGTLDLTAMSGDLLLAVYDGTNWQLRKLAGT